MNHILSILKLIGKDISSALIKFLDNDDFIIKKNAIILIGKLQIKESVDVLLKNLDDMYEDVNKAAIKALGEIGEISAVPELLNILDIEDYHYEYIDLDMKWFVLDEALFWANTEIKESIWAFLYLMIAIVWFKKKKDALSEGSSRLKIIK